MPEDGAHQLEANGLTLDQQSTAMTKVPVQSAVPLANATSDALADDAGLTYPGAPESLISRWRIRRGPVVYGRGECLPPADTDLKALLAQRIPLEEPAPSRKPSHYMRKLLQLRQSLAGKSELAALNADLIVHLRRAEHPDFAPALFRRIWTEEGPPLIAELPGRWLISSVITFADHGETEAQRRIGLAMNVLFSLMKLYEFERHYSGIAPEIPFQNRRRTAPRLPLDMPKFGLRSGGLDVNLLAPIWEDAMKEPVAGPLACHLLHRLNADPSNIFRRIRLMREAKDRQSGSAALQAVPFATDPD